MSSQPSPQSRLDDGLLGSPGRGDGRVQGARELQEHAA